MTALRRYRAPDGSTKPKLAIIEQGSLFGENVVAEKPISREQLARQLASCFADCTAEQLVAMMVSPFDAIVEYAALTRGEKAGQKISLLFNPHRLDIIAGQSNRSLLTALRYPDYAFGF